MTRTPSWIERWREARPIDRPRVRRYRVDDDSDAPYTAWPTCWLAFIDYDAGTQVTAWPSWEEAIDHALLAVGPPERPSRGFAQAFDGQGGQRAYRR